MGSADRNRHCCRRLGQRPRLRTPVLTTSSVGVSGYAGPDRLRSYTPMTGTRMAENLSAFEERRACAFKLLGDAEQVLRAVQ